MNYQEGNLRLCHRLVIISTKNETFVADSPQQVVNICNAHKISITNKDFLLPKYSQKLMF